MVSFALCLLMLSLHDLNKEDEGAATIFAFVAIGVFEAIFFIIAASADTLTPFFIAIVIYVMIAGTVYGHELALEEGDTSSIINQAFGGITIASLAVFTLGLGVDCVVDMLTPHSK